MIIFFFRKQSMGFDLTACFAASNNCSLHHMIGLLTIT